MVVKNFGMKILQLRQAGNMTQEELALRIGVTPQALSKWERGQSLPDLPIFADLCRVLDRSADVLLGLERERITENDDPKMQDEIFRNLRHSLDPMALVEGIVPEKISYGLLQEVFGRLLDRGCPPVYLPKIIEAMESVLYDRPGLSSDELSEQVYAALMPDAEKLLI